MDVNQKNKWLKYYLFSPHPLPQTNPRHIVQEHFQEAMFILLNISHSK